MDPLELQNEWIGRVNACRASRQSAVAWCAANKLNIEQYKHWLKKLKKLELVSAMPTTAKSADKSTATPTKWLPVEIDSSATKMPQKTLLIKVGFATIEISPGFDPDLLNEAVRALHASC